MATNIYGREIHKGPKGGEYVLVSGKKVYKFKRASVPVGPSVLNLAKAHMNTLKTAVARKAYVRSRAANMANAANWIELGRYKNTLNARASAARAAKKAPAPAPTAANLNKGKGPAVSNTNEGYTKTKYFVHAGHPVYSKNNGLHYRSNGTGYWIKLGNVAKLYPAPPPPGARSPANATRVSNILSSGAALRTPNRTGLTKTNFIYHNRKVYKKDASGRYYAIAPGETKGFSITLKEHVKKAGTDESKPLKNWLKAPPAPAPAPAPARGSPPAPAGYEKTPYTYGGTKPVYRKTSSGRYWVLPSTGNNSRSGFSVLSRMHVTNTRTGETKALGEFVRATKAKPKPKPTGPTTVASSPSSGQLPTPSPRPVISTAERNRRLAEIRARLNAIKAKRLANMPKTRKNVEQKLRIAYWRARARRNSGRNSLASVPTKTIKISFWHAPARVPRASLSARDVTLRVYTGSNPLIDSGGVVAMQEKDFDFEWFKRQNTYISKLSDYDFWTVQAHTNRSHSWIGPYTYKGTIPRFDELGSSTHIRPLWPQIRKMILNGTYRDDEQWVKNFKSETDEKKRYDMFTGALRRIPDPVKKMALEMYKKDLKRIIAGAPKAKKKMILYRGSNFDIFKGTKGHWYKLRSFCSAAYNVDWATGYGSSGFTRITILPGSPVLLVAGTNQWDRSGEYEVMVNIDTQYLIRTRGVKRHLYRTSGSHDNYYRVTDVIIAK